MRTRTAIGVDVYINRTSGFQGTSARNGSAPRGTLTAPPGATVSLTVAIWELAGQLYHPGDHFGTFAIDIDITNAHAQPDTLPQDYTVTPRRRPKSDILMVVPHEVP